MGSRRQSLSLRQGLVQDRTGNPREQILRPDLPRGHGVGRQRRDVDARNSEESVLRQNRQFWSEEEREEKDSLLGRRGGTSQPHPYPLYETRTSRYGSSVQEVQVETVPQTPSSLRYPHSFPCKTDTREPVQ